MGRIAPILLAALIATPACDRITGARNDVDANLPGPLPLPPPPPPAPAPEPERVEREVVRAAPPPDPEAEERARAAAARAAFEARFPQHGITFHFLARVRARPHHEAEVAGYMRRGARFRASERVPGVGCRRGWHEVPGGGFVCRGEGFLVGDEPPEFEPVPTAPALEDPMPYSYAHAPRDDVAQYWRLPSTEEERRARDAIDALSRAEERAAERAERAAAEAEARAAAEAEAAEARAAAEAEAAEARAAAEVAEASDEVAAEEAADAEAEEAADAALAATEIAAETTPAAAVEAPAPPGTENDEGAGTDALAAAAHAEELDVEVPDFVRMRMRRGFYISIDEEQRDGTRRFFRTVRGAYVRADRVYPNEPPTHRGVVLGGSWDLPVGFVWRGGTHRLRRRPDGRFRDTGTVDRHTALRVRDTLERHRQTYVVSNAGDVVRRSSVRLAERVDRPEGVTEDERWIHVDLSEQTLVAYEGDRPVFATTVSTGREGFETPTGIFRIKSKHVSTTMDDLHGDEPYLIEDVPWTMYFEGNFALHAAFWHRSFGRVRSHGCVNLAPSDARWLFQWSGPSVPTSWHGVFSDRDERRGSAVYVTD